MVSSWIHFKHFPELESGYLKCELTESVLSKLKKDLEIYKDMYKYQWKILDKLLCCCLFLIKDNFKNNNDVVNYIDNLFDECILIGKSLNSVFWMKKDVFNNLFSENKKFLLKNDEKAFEFIKENYEKFKKLFIK